MIQKNKENNNGIIDQFNESRKIINNGLKIGKEMPISENSGLNY